MSLTCSIVSLSAGAQAGRDARLVPAEPAFINQPQALGADHHATIWPVPALVLALSIVSAALLRTIVKNHQAQAALSHGQTRLDALEESEERLRLVIMGSHDAPWDWDLINNDIYYSPQWWEQLGYAPDERRPEADLWRLWMHPDDAAHVTSVLDGALRNHLGTFAVELRLLHKDGHYVPVLARAFITRDDGGRPLRVTGANMNLSERQRAEQTLRETNAYLENLINYANAPIIVWDPQFRITRFNHAFEFLSGRTEVQVLGQSLETLFPPALRERSMALIRETLSGQRWEVVEIKIQHCEGSERTVLWNSATLFTPDGQTPLATIAQGQDITERKRAEDELHETNAYLENLINYANAPIIVWDPQFRITRFNQAFEFLSGYTEAQVLGKSLDLLFPPALCEHSMGLIRQTLSGQRWEVVEIKIQHRDGSVRTVLWNSATLFAADGQTPLATIAQGQDITERKQAEEQLARAKEAAEAANRAKSEFLANMSHEIRTPLNSILGFAQVLGRDPALNATQRDSLTTIQRSGEHLLILINDILDMAKIEAGRMTVQAAPFDLTTLVAEAESFFRQRAHERGLALTVASSVLPRMVVGDAMKLRQVLINLVGNAVKFTTEGAVTLRVEPVADDLIRFSVIDTGMGIAPAEMARLFEPFGQTASGRHVQGGTGLGLALSSRFVRLMGGELRADSTPGQGSCFSFTLVLAPTAAIEPRAERAELPVLGLEPGQPVCRVLIVDDLPDNRAPLRALLDMLNPQPPVLELREAADGREAVALWEAWQPQVVFMDMRMPVMSGEAATRQIKARMAARPDAVRSVVVALTASAFNENRDHFLACGCDDFAGKPFRAEELFAILERRVGLRFVRAGQTPPAAAALSGEELAAHLTACPEGWRADLKNAAELGDFGRITALLEALRETDPALCAALAKWAYEYDLEAFAGALAGGG
ncbi:PAS domain S-box protein [uncultured Thiodictyon sp.]|jgi:PAS domain S-box-containing protein|uniref:PAS domain S-box protein n=1 Tax=uncultured Thiodictyon sp. TaxID=1846217 RepID=UPI0025EE964F|nr:PAS domain S-box protein [uncultured Thiodictyon sp.]